ncbi:MAG: OmpA family protein [Deltaproteobacteria bacterium]|nr:OmpA family protein [Deltaproteobacteria bacterium]
MTPRKPDIKIWVALLPALGFGVPACSLLTVQQQPFAPLQVSVARPPAPPPRVVLTASSITIAEKIQFALNSAQILPASDSLLTEIAGVLKDNPQIEVVQVEGHTDSTGTPEHNKKLSQQRAESVKAAMVARGVPAKRLVPKGFGLEKPIADNATDEGREKNRRVEFNIVKQGPKKTLVQD